eukprot:TRINITY_DN1912_c0_g1_i1.p1 TRINITY_DN1912_c0_g1~~TRINITY_DN1912_c0_g1_i1.p1  ORF type:complete len:345 (-),score=74.68 TRINITY_DN1912_c0_g1_i1:755-1789(-)
MSSAQDRAARLLNQVLPCRQVSHSVDAQRTSAQQEHEHYRYTRGDGMFTPEQRDFYENNGYIVIKDLVTDEELDGYRDHFVKLCKGEVEKQPSMLLMRDVAIAKKKEWGEHAFTKAQDYQDDPELFAYCKTRKILDYVEAFTGPNIRSMHTMLIQKPPDPGSKSSRHPLHQDLHYFPFRPTDRIVCAWTAMQHVDRSNGCLVLAPGSHRTGELLRHGYPQWEGGVNKAYHGIMNLPKDIEIKHMIMEKGDTVFFHPLLIHGSGANNTTGYRKAISCHYASADCHYIDVTGTIQADIAKEVTAIAKRKTGGMDIPFVDVWKFKSRLLRGKDGTLCSNGQSGFKIT